MSARPDDIAAMALSATTPVRWLPMPHAREAHSAYFGDGLLALAVLNEAGRWHALAYDAADRSLHEATETFALCSTAQNAAEQIARGHRSARAARREVQP